MASTPQNPTGLHPICPAGIITQSHTLNPKGTLTLNLKLIQAPRALIDYVILHELCHLKEMNHSPRFWALLNHVLPGWERLREELNHYEFGEI